MCEKGGGEGLQFGGRPSFFGVVGRPRRVWSFIGVQAVRPGELQVALKREKRVVVGGGLEVEGWRKIHEGEGGKG